jgi:mono/diheme cytochrome c family protein
MKTTRLVKISVASVVMSALLGSFAASAADADGQTAYGRVCAKCHGTKGEGGEGPPLVPLYHEEAQVMAVVRGGQGKMPAVTSSDISDEEITAVVAYLAKFE